MNSKSIATEPGRVPVSQFLTVLADTREQIIPPFPDGVVIERATLCTGDYSTPNLIDLARIERKSGADFVASLTQGRERFDRELERLERFEHRVVIVECDLGDYYSGAIQTRMHPNSLIGSIASMYARHGVATIFAHSPAIAGRLIAGILRRLEEEHAAEVST